MDDNAVTQSPRAVNALWAVGDSLGLYPSFARVTRFPVRGWASKFWMARNHTCQVFGNPTGLAQGAVESKNVTHTQLEDSAFKTTRLFDLVPNDVVNRCDS